MSKNHWVILKDHMYSKEKGSVNVKSNGFPEWLSVQDLPVRFKMYDDDGILYMEGRMMEADFDPLDDFGMPSYGCTYMRYSERGGPWKHL